MTNHKTMSQSPTYSAHYARFGRIVPLSTAEAIAREHGVSLEDLEDEGLSREGTGVATLSLFVALGY